MELSVIEWALLTNLVAEAEAGARLLARYSEVAEQDNRPSAAVELADAAMAIRRALNSIDLTRVLARA